MFDFPEILPADPSAPEGYTHKARRLTYGPLARTILGLPALPNRLPHSGRRQFPQISRGVQARI